MPKRSINWWMINLGSGFMLVFFMQAAGLKWAVNYLLVGIIHGWYFEDFYRWLHND